MIGLGSYYIQKTTTSDCIVFHLEVIAYIIVAITCADVPNKCKKTHEECKYTDAGTVCHCESGYKQKDGACVGKKIIDKYIISYLRLCP
jgi:hypothetical protein